MNFTALSFVVPFLSYYVLCNSSYDVTRWAWYCNKTENHAHLWIDLTKFAQNLFTYLVNQIKHYPVLDMVSITRDQLPGLFYEKKNFSIFRHCRNFFLILNCPVALKIEQKRRQLVKSQKLLNNKLIQRMILKEERALETNLLLWQPCVNDSNVQLG